MALPLSKKHRVVKALQAHLAGISPAVECIPGEPYVDDLTDKVFLGRLLYGQNDPDLFVSINEAPKPLPTVNAGTNGAGKRKETLELLVQGFVPDDKQNPSDPAYRVLAQIERRLAQIIEVDGQGRPAFPEHYLLARIISALTIGQGIVRAPDGQVSTRTMFYLPLAVEFTVNGSNPYAD